MSMLTKAEAEGMINKGWELLGDEWCQVNGAAVQAHEGSEWWYADLKAVRNKIIENAWKKGWAKGSDA